MDFDGVVYAVAAGAANHAGSPDGGSYKGMTGNSTAWGFEIEHPGTYPLEDDRYEIAACAVAAMIKGTCSEGMVPYHKEWAPSRKIDLATCSQRDYFVSVLINNGDGTFKPAVNYTSPKSSHELAIADMDGDGENDIAVDLT